MTSPLTPEHLKDLRALYDKAKPGEWNLYKGSDRAIATIRFLSLAHNLMPALLDAVEERDRLREALERQGFYERGKWHVFECPAAFHFDTCLLRCGIARSALTQEEPHDPLVDMDISPETEQAARELAARHGLLTTGGDDA